MLKMFAGMDDDYMKARAADVKDISNRLAGNLLGRPEITMDDVGASVIVADDLSSSETVQIDKGNLLDVSTGTRNYANMPSNFIFDSKIYAASLVKQNTNLPVIAVGNISLGEQAENVLVQNFSDMVAVGRGHLCDPAWTNKVLAGEQPILCRNCRPCVWYKDGRKCPAVHKGERI